MPPHDRLAIDRCQARNLNAPCIHVGPVEVPMNPVKRQTFDMLAVNWDDYSRLVCAVHIRPLNSLQVSASVENDIRSHVIVENG
jgi:hypothetical protein